MIDYTGTYTDQYELSMALVYFKKNTYNKKAVFDYFFRKLPFDGGYAVFAGLDDLLTVVENLRFDEKDILYLKKTGFPGDFLDYLEGYRQCIQLPRGRFGFSYHACCHHRGKYA